MDPAIILHPSQWCTPAVIYAVFFLFSMVLGLMDDRKTFGERVANQLIYLVVGVATMYLLLVMCYFDMEWFAWMILLLPFVLYVMVAALYPKPAHLTQA